VGIKSGGGVGSKVRQGNDNDQDDDDDEDYGEGYGDEGGAGAGAGAGIAAAGLRGLGGGSGHGANDSVGGGERRRDKATEDAWERTREDAWEKTRRERSKGRSAASKSDAANNDDASIDAEAAEAKKRLNKMNKRILSCQNLHQLLRVIDELHKDFKPKNVATVRGCTSYEFSLPIV
jgi:hypothetical protein